MAKKDRNNEGNDVNENTASDEVAAEKKIPFCNVNEDDAGVVTFAFGNGNVLTVNPKELPEEMQEQLMVHGLTQKVRDSFSSAKGDYAFAEGAASKVIQQLKDNSWTASRGGGESKPKIGELVQALANLKGLDLAVVQAAVERADDAKRKAWRGNADVKAEIARIRAEAAKKRAATTKVEDIDLGLEIA